MKKDVNKFVSANIFKDLTTEQLARVFAACAVKNQQKDVEAIEVTEVTEPPKKSIVSKLGKVVGKVQREVYELNGAVQPKQRIIDGLKSVAKEFEDGRQEGKSYPKPKQDPTISPEQLDLL